MKRLFSLALLVIAIAAVPAFGQTAGTSVTQTPTHADAATSVAHSHTSAATITIPANGQYVYITSIDISNCAGSAAVTAAVPTYITTTGIYGSPQYQAGSGVGAGLCQPVISLSFGPGGLRSAATGTDVTFVLPTFATNQTLSVNVAYYRASQ